MIGKCVKMARGQYNINFKLQYIDWMNKFAAHLKF